MAASKEEARETTLYAPDGTQVKVTKTRADVLKKRGYVTTKPKND